MDWEVVSEIDLDDTGQLVREVLAAPSLPLPEREQRIGATVVSWWDGKPGDAVVMAEGGTIEDRTLAEQLVASVLRIHGYKRAHFSLDENLRKVAGWPEIMQKAKRLIQSGQVTVLRNGVNNIVGHVIGDHGEYNSEIGRDDPNSRTITTWQCECPWDQYAWQRTRKWKKYEGRPCAHVMALYWKSLATPLDDYNPEEHGDLGTGQKMGPPLLPGAGGGGGGGKTPAAPPMGPLPLPSTPPVPAGPQGSPGQPPIPGLEAPMAPPASPDVLPQPPMEQLQMLQPPMPGTTPAGLPAPPGSVSVPGAKMPTPFNPMQWPGGTYSAMDWRQTAPSIDPRDLNPKPRCPHCGSEHLTLQPQGDWMCLDCYWEEEDRPHPDRFRVSSAPEEPPNYREATDDEDCGGCKMFYEGKCWGYGNKEVEADHVCDSYYPQGKESRVSADFNPPEIVRLKNDAYGMAVGKSEEAGAGQYRLVPEGTTGEVLAQDPTTGWVEVIFPIDDAGPMEPYHVQCFLEPSDLDSTRIRPPGPFIQRRHT